MEPSKVIKFSIVTIVYNCSEEISETIESVLRQTYSSIEYIVIDGASTDGTIDICKNYTYKHRNMKLFSEIDAGIYDAMNKGLSYVSGDYVLFLNSGDTFINDLILSKVSQRIENHYYDFYYGDNLIKLKNNKTVVNRSSHDLSNLWKRMQFSHQTLFVKSQLARKMGYDLTYDLSADYAHIMKLYLLGASYEYLNFPIATYSVGGISEVKRVQSVWQRYLINLKMNQNIKIHFFYPILLISAVAKTLVKKILSENSYWKIKKIVSKN
jgi:putative colanic acid biosynthesis glycosyltransferase